jgi:CBS domain-containing protein
MFDQRETPQKETTMTVKTILSTKGSEVITIGPTATLEEAIAVLAKRRIGAVVVLGAEERVIGILSERDIVRALSERGASALKEPLAQTMTRVVVTCAEADTVSELMERMTRGRFRHIPVLEEDRLIGIISIGDVVKQRLGEMERESEALRDYIQTA